MTQAAMRKLTIATLCMSVVVGVALFDLKSRVTALDRELRRVRAEIAATDQTVHILQAEWAHLNQPDMLNQLVVQHTALAPVRAEQLVTLEDITRESAAANAYASLEMLAPAPLAALPLPQQQASAADVQMAVVQAQ
jgi:hypothetical protein